MIKMRFHSELPVNHSNQGNNDQLNTAHRLDIKTHRFWIRSVLGVMYLVAELSGERSGGVKGAQEPQVSSLVLCYHISAIFGKTRSQRQDVIGQGHPARKRSCYDSHNELWDFES